MGESEELLSLKQFVPVYQPRSRMIMLCPLSDSHLTGFVCTHILGRGMLVRISCWFQKMSGNFGYLSFQKKNIAQNFPLKTKQRPADSEK